MKDDAFLQSEPFRSKRQGIPRPSAFVISLFVLVSYYCFRSTTPRIYTPHQFDLRKTLLSVPSHEQVRNWSAYYTSETHLASQGLKQAQWTQARWKEFGIVNTTISSHDTQLPLPTNEQRLALMDNDQVIYEAPLQDSSPEFVPAYFGFSGNGNISGSYVFCNFGSREDFEDLNRRNVSLAGNIGIIKLGTATPYVREKGLSMFRTLSVHNAEAAGMIGVVLYTDPGNDGPTREGNGDKPFPAGPARPLEAIERGGLGSIEDFKGGKLPSIPCIPMSSADAIQLLSKLNGHGPSAKDFGDLWQEGGLDYYGVNYNVGPSPPGLSLHINSHADIRDTQIRNVIGTIPGRITDEVVIVGNHRDAWGPGAGDPGSGSAALNEVVRSFGVALQQGWRPERTIIFASFEGEEFLQVGSLLWVTKHLDWIKASTVAYLNVVVAASGGQFHAKASPLLYSTILSATDLVLSPNQTLAGQTVRDVWGGNITPAGSGDANRFVHLSTVSTLDIGFTPSLGEPVFPYHTGFDSFEWMDQVGDPGWNYHVTSAKMWSLMTAHLVEPGVLNMNVTDYASAFKGWLVELKDHGLMSPEVDLTAMIDAIERLSRAANRFESFADILRDSQCAQWKFWARCRPSSAISGVNKIYMKFERQFYYEGGINGHDDWHHVVFTPSAWHNTPLPMPGLWKSLLLQDWETAQKWRDILAEKISNAVHLLEEHLESVDTKQAPGFMSWSRQTLRPCHQ